MSMDKRQPLASLGSKIQVGRDDAPALRALQRLRSPQQRVGSLTGTEIIQHLLRVGQMDRSTREALSAHLAAPAGREEATREEATRRVARAFDVPERMLRRRPLHQVAASIDTRGLSREASMLADALHTMDGIEDSYGRMTGRQVVSGLASALPTGHPARQELLVHLNRTAAGEWSDFQPEQPRQEEEPYQRPQTRNLGGTSDADEIYDEMDRRRRTTSPSNAAGRARAQATRTRKA